MENQNAAKTRPAASRNVRTLVECAILIALSFVLSQFTIIELPNGGSITPLSMVPVCLIGFLHGPKWGFGSAFVYSILCLFSGRVFSWGLTPVVLIVCILADYIFAFTVLGITGLFKNKGTKGILIGTFLAVFLRFVCHYISGVTIWRSVDMNPYVYSLLYNGSYMLPECVFTMIGTFALSKVPAFKKILERK